MIKTLHAKSFLTAQRGENIKEFLLKQFKVIFKKYYKMYRQCVQIGVFPLPPYITRKITGTVSDINLKIIVLIDIHLSSLKLTNHNCIPKDDG